MFDKNRYYDGINISYMRKILFICISSLIFYNLMPVNAVFSETKVRLRFSKYFTTGQRIEIAQQPTEKDPHRSKKPLNKNVDAPFMEQKSSLPDTIHQGTDKSGSDNGKEIYGPSEVPVLKKIEIDRIGAAAAYETFEGMRFGKYFTVAQRIEIYQEVKPIDSYILDAKAIRILGQSDKAIPWDQPVNFRSQIVPQFTRAYGTEFTISDPDDKEGQIRYVHDYRDIYKQYYPKYADMGVESWHQHDIFLIHSRKIPGINWYYTSNLGFRYSTINIKNDDTGDELPRMTYMASLSLAPSARLEWFGKFEYYKSKRMRSDYHYSPDHWYYRTELRMRSADFKTSVIPAFSYSVDYYFPFKNRYDKYEMSCRVGRDFTSKLSAASTLNYVLGIREEPDNKAPDYASGMHPYKDTASWIGVENRVSYNIWDKFYIQGGADLACGTNMSDFDNYGTLLGIEYYKPGMVRVNFGWNFNHYYNIEDTLNTIGFKVYIFM